jgi:hypothetical protein
MIAPFAGKNRKVNAQGARVHGRRAKRFQAIADEFVTRASGGAADTAAAIGHRDARDPG